MSKLLIANALAICVVIGKELWAMFKDSTKENTKAINKLTETCQDLSKDIVKLQTQMQFVDRDLSFLPEMRKHIENAHAKIDAICKQYGALNERG
jgi:hypothetical protein